MKKIIKKVLKEDRQEQFLNKIILLMKDDYPLIKKLKDNGFYNDLSEKEFNYVLSGIFGEPVKLKRKYIYNQNGNKIYHEHSDGYWEKYEYDDNGHRIYFQNSNGDWYKSEYHENGKVIYFEESTGWWQKHEYDENWNEIYREDSDGGWLKREYDVNGNRIYYERSDGYIEDNRHLFF